jgi:membrane dipeptidase
MPLEGRAERVAELFERGVRAIGLTWNSANELATGIGAGPRGLTDAGADTIAVMERLGIVVDLAHAAARTFWDVIEVATQPVVVSHANAAALRAHGRNLDDDQLRAIAACGGVVCACAVPAFVADGDVTIDDVVSHLQYVTARIGAGHVGIGADVMDHLDEYDVRFPQGLADRRQLHCRLDLLLARRLPRHDVEQIAGEGFLRVLAGADAGLAAAA